VSVLRYIRLDVFSNQPFTGIQPGVFPDAAGIDERRMQQIANEMALPENTFVPRLPTLMRGFAFSLHPESYRWPGVRRLGRFLRSQDWKYRVNFIQVTRYVI
jgi:hypothetical protein